MKPRNNYVLVEIDKPEDKTTPGGIVLPTMSATPTSGKVLAVGPAEKCKDLKVGDHVMFVNYAGSNVMHEGKACLLMEENQITGLLD